MEDKLIELLQTLNYPVFRQGSLGLEEEYPDTFFTFWNNDESEIKAYDNQTATVGHNYDVNVYSNDANQTYSILREARALLKKNNFIILSRGHDVASDEESHTGRGMTILYIEREV